MNTQPSQPPNPHILQIPRIPLVPKPDPKNRHQDRAQGNRIKTIVYTTCAFAVLSHIAAYRVAELVNEAITGISNQVLSEEGTPTLRGSAIMTAVFLAVVIYLMA